LLSNVLTIAMILTIKLKFEMDEVVHWSLRWDRSFGWIWFWTPFLRKKCEKSCEKFKTFFLISKFLWFRLGL
jgi:hypothetical protein